MPATPSSDGRLAADADGCSAASDTAAANALLDPAALAFYQHTITTLDHAQVPFLVGGAYAYARYTGIERHTKDFDIFVREADVERALNALAAAGYQTERTFPHWLAKAHHGEYFVDLIYGSGNGVATVDEEWFEHAVDDHVFAMRVKLVPAEEMIWSKAFIMERERFDGGDVAHILLKSGDKLDWERLLRRFGPYWRVLSAHLILFGFIYPSERGRIPDWVMRGIANLVLHSLQVPPHADTLCRGTLLSRQQYLVDMEQWGFDDVRLRPENPMTDADILLWTAGIAVDGS